MFLVLFAMVTGPSDADLVERFKAGNRRAFEEIVRRYQNRVYTLALRWMGDEQVASEVAQDVFVALYRSLANFRGDALLSTWVYRVVVNHCKNRKLYQRRRKTDRHESLDGDPNDGDAPRRQYAGDGPLPDTGIHQTEAERLIRVALDELPEDQRMIIVMRDVEDLSYEEIAEVLDLPRGTVKSRLHRARAHLAKVLGRSLGNEDIF
jgi:RNA polymerase sigma-70 factor (ECF subfamily)